MAVNPSAPPHRFRIGFRADETARYGIRTTVAQKIIRHARRSAIRNRHSVSPKKRWSAIILGLRWNLVTSTRTSTEGDHDDRRDEDASHDA